MKRTLWLLAICLVGCGGGGSSIPTPVAVTAPIPPPPLAPSPTPVVFIGDSITIQWDTLCGHFTDCVNAGVRSQTSAQMLARFQTDVLAHKPGVVAIMGGTNDMFLETSPAIDNITTMAEEASASGALVIIELVPPTPRWPMAYKGLTGEAAIAQWNADLRVMARAYGYGVADYYDAMLMPDGSQNTALFISDFTHPNQAGYSVMWRILQPLMTADGVVTN